MTAVAPSASAASTGVRPRRGGRTPCSRSQAGVPTSTRRPSPTPECAVRTTPETPWPGLGAEVVHLVGADDDAVGAGRAVLLARPAATAMARRSGARRAARRPASAGPHRTRPRPARRRSGDDVDQRHAALRDRARSCPARRCRRARVCSRISGPLMRMPSWAPRPVPTSSAVGVARPRAHGQAMISTATAAVNAACAPPPVDAATRPACRPRGPARRARTPPRSGRPAAARAPCRSARARRAGRSAPGGSPRRRAWPARRSAPDVLTVAPVTSSPGPTSTGTGSPVSSDVSSADGAAAPRRRRWRPSRPAARRTRRRPPARSTGTRARCGAVGPVTSSATSLAPRSSSARSASPARRRDRCSAYRPASRNVVTTAATSKYSSGDAVPIARAAAGHSVGRHRACRARPRRRAAAPTATSRSPRRSPMRDERVHGRGAVPGGPERGTVERPGRPRGDGQRERRDHPLPAAELQRRDHRQQQHGHRQHGRDAQPARRSAPRASVGADVSSSGSMSWPACLACRTGRARPGPSWSPELRARGRGRSGGAGRGAGGRARAPTDRCASYPAARDGGDEVVVGVERRPSAVTTCADSSGEVHGRGDARARG